jgi:hypothetical protein
MKRWPPKKVWQVDLQVITPSDKRAWDACEALEYEIFLKCGYISASKDARISDFDSYARMEFIVALSHGSARSPLERRLVGAFRLVYPPDQDTMHKEMFPTTRSARRLSYSSGDVLAHKTLRPPFEDNKTLWLFADKYTDLLAMHPKRCFDMATGSITEEGRRLKAAVAMASRTMMRAWEQPPIRYALLALDIDTYQKWSVVAPPRALTPLGPTVQYWGSPTIPFLVDAFLLPKGALKLFILFHRLKGYLHLKTLPKAFVLP